MPRSKLPPEPTATEANSHRFAAVEKLDQAEFPPADTNQLATEVSNIPISDDQLRKIR